MPIFDAESLALRPDLSQAIGKLREATAAAIALLDREPAIKAEWQSFVERIQHHISSIKDHERALTDLLNAPGSPWQEELQRLSDVVAKSPLLAWCDAVTHLTKLLTTHGHGELATSLESVLADLDPYYFIAYGRWSGRSWGPSNPSLSESERVELCQDMLSALEAQRTAERLALISVDDFLAHLVDEPVMNAPAYAHSTDFRSVVWNGVQYSFSANQAAAVRLLWQNWENGTPEISDETILDEMDAQSEIRFAFRDHPAMGHMILRGATKGTHRLAGDSQKLKKHGKLHA